MSFQPVHFRPPALWLSGAPADVLPHAASKVGVQDNGGLPQQRGGSFLNGDKCLLVEWATLVSLHR